MNNLTNSIIPVWVFGTLRKGGDLAYYMDGSLMKGYYTCKGQLMMSENGNAFIDFEQETAFTLGELYYVDYSCLLRINHLESKSGEFPKSYDLDMLQIYPYTHNTDSHFEESKSQWAFFYRRRSEPIKIKNGDWIKRKRPVEELGKLLSAETNQTFTEIEIINYMKKYLYEW